MSHRLFKFKPIKLKNANKFIDKYHRHNKPVTGHKYSISVVNKKTGETIGVAIIGRPISRYLDDGNTLEILRLCVKDNNKNLCSMIYGRVTKIAFLLGYESIITYTLDHEKGVSLLASGFEFDGLTKWSKGWNIRNGKQLTLTGLTTLPEGNKKRYIRRFD
jgi:hypothetical protein